MTVSADVTEKVAAIALGLLNERFGDQFVFDPVFAESKIDHDGDEYLEIFVVYDGDMKKLDPGWTVGIGHRMRPALLEIGVTSLPGCLFVEKSDWEEGPPD